MKVILIVFMSIFILFYAFACYIDDREAEIKDTEKITLCNDSPLFIHGRPFYYSDTHDALRPCYK